MNVRIDDNCIMEEKIILVDVYLDDVLIDHFEFPIRLGEYITFPDKKPYYGLQYLISTGPNNTYEFSPDGYEMWIRFNDERVGQCIEYLDGKSYKFLYKTNQKS